MKAIRRLDRQLVQIVNAAHDDAARRSGEWLVCRPGCSQCCVGVFAISQLDAMRLREGLKQLEKTDPERARRVKARAAEAVVRLRDRFPGDAGTGILSEEPEDAEAFEDFANDEPCPVLDPETGRCDLYEVRPMTCRVFGPPVRSDGGLGVCELCYQGATAEEIAGCELHLDTDKIEGELVREVESCTGKSGRTVVGFAVVQR